MAFDADNLDKIITNIEKNYGKGTIRKASEVADIRRIPTNIIEIDALTGGGLPFGRWCHVFGGYSSGKTLFMLHMIAQAQKMGLTCAYYNLETQFNKEWAASIGVDVDKLWVIEGSVIEEVGTKLESLLTAINIHVIDSLGFGVSVDELNTKVDEWRPGISARAWGKVIRRAGNYFDQDNNMIVLVNQVRDAFGKGIEEPTGGRAIEHVSSLSLHFNRSSWLYKDKNGILSKDAPVAKTLHDDTMPNGIELLVKLKKSRVGDPLGSTRLRFEFASGGHFDQDWSLVRAAIYYSLVQKSSSWYTLPDGNKVQGESGIRTYMNEHPEFREEIKKALLS